MSRTTRWLLIVSAVVILAGIVVVAAVGHGFAGGLVGGILITVGGMLLVALMFYEVGLSEDRERDRDRRS